MDIAITTITFLFGVALLLFSLAVLAGWLAKLVGYTSKLGQSIGLLLAGGIILIIVAILRLTGML